MPLIIFMLVPIVEMWILIEVGGWIGRILSTMQFLRLLDSTNKMKNLFLFARLFTGALFIFSGIVKLNDPSGFAMS